MTIPRYGLKDYTKDDMAVSYIIPDDIKEQLDRSSLTRKFICREWNISYSTIKKWQLGQYKTTWYPWFPELLRELYDTWTPAAGIVFSANGEISYRHAPT